MLCINIGFAFAAETMRVDVALLSVCLAVLALAGDGGCQGKDVVGAMCCRKTIVLYCLHIVINRCLDMVD